MSTNGPPVEWLREIQARHAGDGEVGCKGRKHVDRGILLVEYAALWAQHLVTCEQIGKLQIRIAELEGRL